MPAHGSDASKLRADLARIRAEVEAGNPDLGPLGFWRIVARVKREPALIEALADDIGEIDRLAFERRHRVRFSIGFGNLVLTLGTAAFVGLFVFLASRTGVVNLICPCPDADEIYLGSLSQTVRGFGLLVVAGGFSITLHDLAHWVVGRVSGIRFRAYFLNGPFRIQPGIKTDYASYLRIDPRRRARMHAAGAVASKLAPFLVLLVAYLIEASYFFRLFPPWSFRALFLLGMLQIVTDVVWSTKRSDWNKWARERRVATDLYSRGTPGSSGQPG